VVKRVVAPYNLLTTLNPNKNIRRSKMLFATFKTNNGVKSGIVLEENSKTTVIQPIIFYDYSIISNSHKWLKDGPPRSLHNQKAHVRIYPKNIIPIN